MITGRMSLIAVNWKYYDYDYINTECKQQCLQPNLGASYVND